MLQLGGLRPVRLGAPDTNIADPQRRGTSDFNFSIKPDPFQKGWIVADNEEGAVKGSQRLLEKLDGIDIKVIGWFVHNDEPRRR
jgi:hypothetical protein